jgi:hypothetical protein
MFARARLWLLVLALGLATSGTVCQITSLVNPPEVSFPEHDERAVQQAVTQALANRGWLAVPEGPGVIRGILNIRDHQAVIRIRYTRTTYDISYVSSQNLNYSDQGGVERIHANYNDWIKNLMTDLDTLLAAPQASGAATR